MMRIRQGIKYYKSNIYLQEIFFFPKYRRKNAAFGFGWGEFMGSHLVDHLMDCGHTGNGRWMRDLPQTQFDGHDINTLDWRAQYISNEAVQMTVNAFVRESRG
jgi:hypothetical protein